MKPVDTFNLCYKPGKQLLDSGYTQYTITLVHVLITLVKFDLEGKYCT